MNEIQRIPLATSISTRDGVLCHDAKIVNGWIETPDNEDIYVAKRYGFSEQATLTGTSIGQGIHSYGANQFAIFADTIYRNNVSGISLTVTVPDLIFRFESAPQASGLTGFFFKSTQDAFFYDTTALTVTKITDPDYPAVTVPGVSWLNGRFFVASDSGAIRNSAINNPFSWSALAVIQTVADAESIVALTKLRSYIVALKQFSIEYFFDVGTAPPASPLQRVESAFVETGCVSAESFWNTDTSLFFVGQTKRTRGRKIYKCEGYTPQRVSTDFIEKIVDGDNLSNVRAFAYSPQGKDFYVLQLFNSERTLVFDMESNAWYIWASKELQATKDVLTLTFIDNAGVEFLATATVLAHGYEDGDLVIIAGASPSTYNGTFAIRYLTANTFEYVLPIDPLIDATGTITSQGFDLKAFRPSGYATTTSDDEFFQDRVNGKIYTISTSDLDDDGVHIDYRVVTKKYDFDAMGQQNFASTNTKTYTRVEPIGDKTLTDSLLYIRHTDDDYRTFSPFRSVLLSDDRPQLRALGSARRRAFEIRHHDTANVRFNALEVELKPGGLT